MKNESNVAGKEAGGVFIFHAGPPNVMRSISRREMNEHSLEKCKDKKSDYQPKHFRKASHMFLWQNPASYNPPNEIVNEKSRALDKFMGEHGGLGACHIIF